MAGYITLDEGAYLQPRLSYTNEHSPYLSHPTTDQQRHENISTVTEASLERVLASGGIQRVKCQRGFKAITQRATSKLQRPITLKATGSHSITLSTKDKLAIIFRYKNSYVVCRIRDSTVTVLMDPIFKTKNPTIIYDGYQKGDILNNVKMILMFAVAKTAHESAEIHFKSLDLILVLAKSGEVYLGVSPSSEVGFFPREKVVFITKPRTCIYPGLIIKVQAITDMIFEHQTIRRGKLYSVCKGNDDPFDWRLPSSHLRIHLESFREHDVEGLEPLPEIPWQRRNPYEEYGAVPPNTNVCFEEHIYDVTPGSMRSSNSPARPRNDVMPGTERSSDDPGRPIYNVPPGPVRSANSPARPAYVPLWNSKGPPRRERDGENDILYITDANGEDFSDESQSFEDSDDENEDLYITIDDYDDVFNEDIENNEPVETPIPLPRALPRLSTMVPSDAPDFEGEDLVHVEDEHGYNTISEAPIEKQKALRNEQAEEFEEHFTEWFSRLIPYRDVVINEDLKGIIAEYVDDDVWHELGRRIGVSKNKRREIETQKETIHEKTYELLGIWHENSGSEATIGFLLDALVKVNPEDLGHILEKTFMNLQLDGNNEYENSRYTLQENTTQQIHKEHEIGELLDKLSPFRDVVINDELRAAVAECVEDDVFHDLGEKMKIPRIKLRDIKRQKNSAYEKTYHLLGIWHEKFDSDANVGFLLDALVKVNPVDLKLILEDVLRKLSFSDARERGQSEEIPDKESTVSKENKKPYHERVQRYMNSLRNKPDVEINNEVRHIVSQYIDSDVWHKLGRILEISKNMREKIEANREDICMKVYDLLGQWHQTQGSDATIHALLNALEEVNPEDLHLILRDLSKALDRTD